MTEPQRDLGSNYSEFIGAMRWIGDTTQEEFASAIGAAPQTVARWEHGTSVPQRRYQDTIAGVLRLSDEEKTYLGRPHAIGAHENPKLSEATPNNKDQLLGALMLRAQKGPALSTIEGIILLSLIDEKRE